MLSPVHTSDFDKKSNSNILWSNSTSTPRWRRRRIRRQCGRDDLCSTLMQCYSPKKFSGCRIAQ